MFFIIVTRGLQRDIIFSFSDTSAWICVSRVVGPHRQSRVLLSVQQGHSRRTRMGQREGHQCAHPSTAALHFHCWRENFPYLGRYSLEIIMYFILYLQYKVTKYKYSGRTNVPMEKFLLEGFQDLLLCSRHQSLGNCRLEVYLTWMWGHWAFLWQWDGKAPLLHGVLSQ